MPVDHCIDGGRVRYWRSSRSAKDLNGKTFAKLPIVLNADGSPWIPAALWMMDRAQLNPTKLTSLLPLTHDLRDYKEFLDDLSLDWDDFSSVEKFSRPTYLYKTHLEALVNSRDIKPSTARRRMSTVVAFYRFAHGERRLGFEPANAPWAEKKIGLLYRDSKGFSQVKQVITTDLRVSVPSAEDDAFSSTIDDGGKLKPMTMEEQHALVRALRSLGNTECSLMHYLGLLTGAREMTVMTLRVRDFLKAPSEIRSWPFKLRCGPGTGIDTKGNKNGVFLNIAPSLYEYLYVYAKSARAQSRRAKSHLGESELNYLFLTRQGNPYYESKDDRNALREITENLRRTSPQGQALREFIAKRVIPEVRKTIPGFSYKFHDTRATFGMNWVDHVMGEDDADPKKFHWAMDQLRRLMWHKRTVTTEKYLEYRRERARLDQAVKWWSSSLLELIQSGCEFGSTGVEECE